MLRGLRKASTNWLGKVVMAAVVGFLTISFAIWGIGDIFRGFGGSTVAKVGRTEISMEQFRVRYNEQLQQLGRQLGRPITPDQAQAFGLEQRTLGQMIASAALDERARQFRLGISDAEVVKQITSDPAFRGFTGEFDHATFLQRIRDIGYSEQRFVFEQRQTTLRRQIAEAVGAGVAPPKAAAEAIDHYRDEERSIEYVTLDGSKVGDVPAPTPEQLSAYFEERKVAFRAPEFRKIQLITVSQQEIAGTIEISDEEAKRVYQDRLKLYETPERRHIVQISFANAEDAKRASERVTAGLPFDDLAKAEVNKIRDKIDEELGGGAQLEEIAKKLNLKLRTIAAVDRSGRTPEGGPVADLPAGVDVVSSAFNTEIGNENEALALSGGGFVWYDVVNVTPSRERKLDEVKDRVEARFREDETIKRVNAKTTEIIGKLKSGASLAEVAAAEGLMVEAKSGLRRQGGAQLPPRVITEVFRTAKDQVGSAEGQNATDRVIFRVADIKMPTFDANSADAKRLIDQLKDAYNDDLLSQYVAGLEGDMGTDVNQNALAQAVGRAPSQSGF